MSVGKGMVFFDLKGKVRMRTLELMGESTVLLLLMVKNTFSRMDDFGVPISNLKQIIDMKASDRSNRTAWYSYRFDR
jgi:hypothetical protein